ncbi:alpha/beta fold hydrolase [Campylobacter sputorum]|uniref:alpha/beta fold hydrolase n=1 Tax=Campylobacter sputorum TaxID=206 RepID=UPI00053C0123|nr:alpha/beta hydrolase [Campylobacter sputorum]
MAVKEIKFGFKKYNINYEILNQNNQKDIVFLHGWGANKEIMKKAFGSKFSEFRHIYVDLPGFGKSSMHSAINTKDYAKIISRFLKEINSTKDIVVGHSFGGKVGVLLNPNTLVLLSSAGIVVKKRIIVRLKIAIFKFFKMLGFGFLYKLFASKDVAGMSKEMYETLKKVVDEDYSPYFGAYRGRALIFWGKEDRTTPLKCGERINSLIKNSELFALSGDHFFFLLHGEFINNVVLSDCTQSHF